ncbi:hypothetical protein ABEY41_12355 [Peribacillus butanolivorans]|uniref:hypothetical protein n=1 Tax=Peribacillus butanolivorans TaxID=421767 RepID=UPI003D2CE330
MIAEELKTLCEKLVSLREENQEIKIHLENQENFNKALVEQPQKFERGNVERNDQLTKTIKEAKEKKKLIADTNRDKHKKGFFARLIGK